MKLAFIGIGKVGFALAHRLQNLGYTITIGHDNSKSESVTKALAKNPKFRVAPVQEAINNSEVVFLAAPFNKAQQILSGIKLSGKILVDCTNPVGPGVSHGLNSTVSGSEQIQEWSQANVVKAFTVYGYENFLDSSFPDFKLKPVMPIAGNDESSKQKISPFIEALGFEVLDTGPLTQALHLEHMTLLWVKMVRMYGRTPHFTWGLLQK